MNYRMLGLILGLIIFALLSVRLLRSPWLRPRQRPVRPMRELAREYGKWEALCALLYLGFTALICWGWAQLLMAEGARQAAGLEGKHLLLPEPALWYAPSLFVGLGLAALITAPLMKLLLRGRFHEYYVFSSNYQGLNPRRILPPLVTLFLVFGLGFSALLPFWHTRFTREAIMHNPLLGLREQRFPYKDASRLQVQIKQRPYRNELRLELEMSDGSVWKSSRAPGPLFEDDWGVVELIEKGMNGHSSD